MDIGWAIKQLKEGERVTRQEWQRHAKVGKERFLIMMGTDCLIFQEFNILSSIWLKNYDDSFIPATFSQLDIMAEDYVLFKS